MLTAALSTLDADTTSSLSLAFLRVLTPNSSDITSGLKVGLLGGADDFIRITNLGLSMDGLGGFLEDLTVFILTNLGLKSLKILSHLQKSQT